MQLPLGIPALGPKTALRREVSPGARTLAVDILPTHHATVVIGLLPETSGTALVVGRIRRILLVDHWTILPGSIALSQDDGGVSGGMGRASPLRVARMCDHAPCESQVRCTEHSSAVVGLWRSGRHAGDGHQIRSHGAPSGRGGV